MSKEKFIRGKVDEHRHAGKRSNLTRLEIAIDKIKDWRREREYSHEQGHSDVPLDQEIVMFPQAVKKYPLDKK